ncbi:MAG: NUDIX domain-containing protein [Phenylobacterium sp.]|uniref:NUDIX hydrolase n=1 Tax=Phenylobacterium sp. TaxID=1871053 RepID=UPI001A206F99|nr:NUDIX domain-containing protein [Phenylobacterium sp.]MBJ7413780.1 NUDIX domain-containing protein [Phenylobacterium sp.]
MSRTQPERPTARVLLFDAQDRILLMKGRRPGAWFTVGGGVEPGETFIEAAAREIREETGIADFVLGPVVWVREGVMRLPEPTLLKECYIVARCDGGDPVRDGWNAIERELIDDIRWWTLGELHMTQDRVFPPGLPHRLPPIIAGSFPVEPEVIPWI